MMNLLTPAVRYSLTRRKNVFRCTDRVESARVNIGQPTLDPGDAVLDIGVVPGAEVVCETGSEVVGFVVGASSFGERRFDLLDHGTDFMRRLDAGDPACADSRRPADGRLAVSADPERQRVLYRAR